MNDWIESNRGLLAALALCGGCVWWIASVYYGMKETMNRADASLAAQIAAVANELEPFKNTLVGLAQLEERLAVAEDSINRLNRVAGIDNGLKLLNIDVEEIGNLRFAPRR